MDFSIINKPQVLGQDVGLPGRGSEGAWWSARCETLGGWWSVFSFAGKHQGFNLILIQETSGGSECSNRMVWENFGRLKQVAELRSGSIAWDGRCTREDLPGSCRSQAVLK